MVAVGQMASSRYPAAVKLPLASRACSGALADGVEMQRHIQKISHASEKWFAVVGELDRDRATPDTENDETYLLHRLLVSNISISRALKPVRTRQRRSRISGPSLEREVSEDPSTCAPGSNRK
jgi:hypothetical protein